MPSVTIKIDAALAKVSESRLRENISSALSRFSIDVEREAKQLAPVDEGALRSAIFSTPSDPNKLSVSFGCNIFYAAYIEFGTRKYAARYVATLPQSWKAYAATFKGRGGSGSFDAFVQNIMAWVLRKGIGGSFTASGAVSSSASNLDRMQQTAYAIALSIVQNGIKPQPFIYPAYLKARKKLDADLEKITR